MRIQLWKTRFDEEYIFQLGADFYEMNAQANQPNGVDIYLGDSDKIEKELHSGDFWKPIGFNEAPPGLKTAIIYRLMQHLEYLEYNLKRLCREMGAMA